MYKSRSTFSGYERVKRTIPNDWIRKDAEQNTINSYKIVIPKYLRQISNPFNKGIYATLVQKKSASKSKSNAFWENNIHIEVNWKQAYLCSMAATQSTYLRALHYKVIHNFVCKIQHYVG